MVARNPADSKVRATAFFSYGLMESQAGVARAIIQGLVQRLRVI